jgi:Bardet-Biedl syndrome 9 protein
MGSLFKLRDFWAENFNEEFDSRSLIIGNLDNDPSGQPKLLLGSFQGVLRLILPKTKGSHPDDILLEMKLQQPIIGLAQGTFLPNNNRTVIAVLFPRKLVLMQILRGGNTDGGDSASGVSGGGSIENYYSAHVCIEHHLEHTAYNMAVGSFGNVSGAQEYVMVQSMDGQVVVFDHNKLIFSRYLPSSHFLVPGILVYVPKLDAFLTNSSTLELHAYKYHTLAASVGSETKNEEKLGRKIVPDWSFNLGEETVDIQYCRLTRGLLNNQVDIIVLCERTLYVLRDTGELRYNKRLDFVASTLCSYFLPDNKTQNIIVGSHSEHISIFSDKCLLWCCKMSGVPIAICTGSFCKVDGMIVTLTDSGGLSIGYLGTDPANNPVQTLESKELDYDAMDSEHKRLQVIIRQALQQGKVEPREVLHIKCDVGQLTPQLACQVNIMVSHSGMGDLQNIVLVVKSEEPIITDQATRTIAFLPAGETVVVPVMFYAGPNPDHVVPTGLNIDVMAIFTSNLGESQTAKASVLLPLGMVAMPVPPMKNTNFKIQVDTNKAPPPPLHDIFQDLTVRGEVGPNVMSVQYCNGADATILVSRNAGRYRVQSNSFEGMWLLTAELVRRLREYYERVDRTEPLRIDIPEPLPLEEYFSVIDTHEQMRVEQSEAQMRLARAAHQFRAIQKRLLVRYRDRNPAPIASLELLMNETYRSIHQCGDDVDVRNSRLHQAAVMVSCATNLLLLMTSLKHADTLSAADVECLTHCLTPVVVCTTFGTGWAQACDAALMHLLRTTLSRNAKEAGAVAQPIPETPDITKLKKHITIVMDRISKGSAIADRGASDGRKL